jgi:hypothetical protein
MNRLANELDVIGDSENDHSCDVDIHRRTSLNASTFALPRDISP